MFGPKKISNKKCIIIISSNRSKIKKKLDLNKYYLDSKTFRDETSEYYN